MNAGGDGRADLTQCINDKLLSLAFQDRLQRETKSGGPPEAVSMFAGTQSTTAPFRAAGYSAVWNAELTQEIDMGLLFDNAIAQYQIDLSGYFNGKRGELVAKVVAAWPKAAEQSVQAEDENENQRAAFGALYRYQANNQRQTCIHTN